MSEGQKIRFRERFREYLEKQLGEPFERQNDRDALKIHVPLLRGESLPAKVPRLLLGQSGRTFSNALLSPRRSTAGTTTALISSAGMAIASSSFRRSTSSGNKPTKRPLETREDVDHFRAVLGRLHEFAQPKPENEQGARRGCAEIDWEHDNFALYYITLRQFPSDLLKWAKSPIPVLKDQPPDLPRENRHRVA